MTDPSPAPNPLLEPWTGPFEAPPFDRIAPRHFECFADAGFHQHVQLHPPWHRIARE